MAWLDLRKNQDSKPNSVYKINSEIYKKSLDFEARRDNSSMKSIITVQSNSMRDKVLVLGTTIVGFDANGVGKVPVSAKEALEFEMKHRPGRYHVLDEVEANPEPVVEAPVEEVSSVEADLLSALESTDEEVALETEELTEEEPEEIEEEPVKKQRGRPKGK